MLMNVFFENIINHTKLKRNKPILERTRNPLLLTQSDLPKSVKLQRFEDLETNAIIFGSIEEGIHRAKLVYLWRIRQDATLGELVKRLDPFLQDRIFIHLSSFYKKQVTAETKLTSLILKEK